MTLYCVDGCIVQVLLSAAMNSSAGTQAQAAMECISAACMGNPAAVCVWILWTLWTLWTVWTVWSAPCPGCPVCLQWC